MSEFITLLREFPAVWAIVGSTISAVIVFVVARRFTPIYSSAVKDLSAVYKLQIEGHERALQMQKTHWENELSYQRTAFASLQTERDDYRTKLHEERTAHQATTLLLADAQARPNVEQVYKGQQEFFFKMSKYMEEQTDTMKAIHKSLVDHDNGVEKRTSDVVQKVVTALRK